MGRCVPGRSRCRKLFLQQANGTFADRWPAAFKQDSVYEDVDATFFDADGDLDLDLYVVTGSNEFTPGAPELADRLYQQMGKATLSAIRNCPISPKMVPAWPPLILTLDGDVDLFIGGRMIPGQYGYDPPSQLYVNDGTGKFKNYTKRYLPKSELG